jgi:glycosyltransferase involved in cell wall biosynthesis
MTNNATQSWSIILLCYNEEDSINKVVIESLETLKVISKNKGQIVIVNDGSTDNSHQIIEEVQKHYTNITYIRHIDNRGIGEALHSGYSNAVEENVIMVSGDGQFDVKELIPYKKFSEDTFLSFFRVNNHIYNAQRKLLSEANRLINQYFIGIKLKDVNFTKAYKNDSLKKLNLRTRSSLVETEICGKLIFLGITPIQIESTYQDKLSGKSSGASFKIIKKAIWDIPKLIWVCLKFKMNHQQ